MTCKELYEKLGEFVKAGGGELPVYFDTDARKFDYHWAEVGKAYLENGPEMEGLKHVCLVEA